VDLTSFAEAVGEHDPVTCVGHRTRWLVGGYAEPRTRTVSAPAGIDRIEPEEMVVSCGAGTPVDELLAAVAEHGQRVALPRGGTVGGALAVGRSDVARLGRGPVRDAVLQARVVNAEGHVVKAGGPTVKNVSGFDLCRLFVGSLGTLGFFGDVILRTRPSPLASRWYRTEDGRDPFELFAALYRPSSVLWDGTTTWVLLEGHPEDVREQAAAQRLTDAAGPPPLPFYRHSLPPAELRGLTGRFVAEIGVGLVHRDQPAAPRPAVEPIVALHHRLKAVFDPSGRLNPGRDPLLL
jgi:glycolate oxidase FAD binding subunit